MTKLFDSMAKLKFKPGEPSDGRFAEGMIAKDGEYVKFFQEVDCNGPVSKIKLKKYILCLTFDLFYR